MVILILSVIKHVLFYRRLNNGMEYHVPLNYNTVDTLQSSLSGIRELGHVEIMSLSHRVVAPLDFIKNIREGEAKLSILHSP